MPKVNNKVTGGKKFWKSKTFWINILSIFGLIVQSQTGYVIPPEIQAALLGIANTGLRLVTKEPLI